MDQVTVEKLGCDQWPRYVVKDERHRFWSGERWSEQEADALLFDEEYRAMKSALELCFDSKLRHFTTTVDVFVDGDEPFTTELLRKFLESNCFVWLGNNGDDETFEKLRVDVDVEWDELKESV